MFRNGVPVLRPVPFAAMRPDRPGMRSLIQHIGQQMTHDNSTGFIFDEHFQMHLRFSLLIKMAAIPDRAQADTLAIHRLDERITGRAAGTG